MSVGARACVLIQLFIPLSRSPAFSVRPLVFAGVAALATPYILRALRVVYDFVQCVRVTRAQGTSDALYGSEGIMSEWAIVRDPVAPKAGAVPPNWLNLGLWSGACACGTCVAFVGAGGPQLAVKV